MGEYKTAIKSLDPKFDESYLQFAKFPAWSDSKSKLTFLLQPDFFSLQPRLRAHTLLHEAIVRRTGDLQATLRFDEQIWKAENIKDGVNNPDFNKIEFYNVLSTLAVKAREGETYLSNMYPAFVPTIKRLQSIRNRPLRVDELCWSKDISSGYNGLLNCGVNYSLLSDLHDIYPEFVTFFINRK